MTDRRTILKASLLAPALFARPASAATGPAGIQMKLPCVVSTWPFGVAANKAAWTVLSKGGRAVDAVETGVKIPEADLRNHTVGRAGYPDRDGHVTLDACIMDEKGNAGSVAGMEYIAHPISVARAVMDKTPHVMLVGEGATQFAVSQGFKREELLTPESKKAWQEWLKTAKYKPESNIETKSYGMGVPGGAKNHDTIGMLAIDAKGNLSGACTTSGMAWKLRGRVGDSPIIGAGTYARDGVCAVSCTGQGEIFIRRVAAYDVAARIHYAGQTLESATHTLVFETLASHHIGAGMVALGATGNPVAPYNTLGMYRGWVTTDGALTVATHRELHAMGPA